MNWFDRMRSGLRTRIKRDVPEGLWSQCKRCGNSIYQTALERNFWICTECGNHFLIGHEEYVSLLADEGTFEALDTDLKASDPLRFRDKKSYPEHVRAGQKATGLNVLRACSTSITMAGVCLVLQACCKLEKFQVTTSGFANSDDSKWREAVEAKYGRVLDLQ